MYLAGPVLCHVYLLPLARHVLLPFQIFGWKPTNKVLRPRYTGVDLMKQIIANPKSGISAYIDREVGGPVPTTDDDQQAPDGSVEVDSDFEDSNDDVAQPGQCKGGIYIYVSSGSTQSQLRLPIPAAGFAMKGRALIQARKPAAGSKKPAKKPKLTVAQAEFLRWCYNRGVANKHDKIGPAQAQQLMPLVGTLEGHKLFPDDPLWALNDIIDPRTGHPKPKFRLSELLDHWSFRPYFSKQKQEFDATVSKQYKLAMEQRAHAASVNVDSSDDGGDEE